MSNKNVQTYKSVGQQNYGRVGSEAYMVQNLAALPQFGHLASAPRGPNQL